MVPSKKAEGRRQWGVGVMRTVWMAVAALLCSGATLAAPDAPLVDVPLVDAVRRGDTEAVRALLDGGADVDSATPDGATALLWAVHTDQPELVGLLLEAGADVEITNRYGVGPASLAAENGNAAILERLLGAGVYANQTLPGGETLLMTAAHTGEPETVRTLLAHGADPNIREMTRGQTALMWAAANDNAAAIHLLAEQGADVNAKTDNPSPSSGRYNFGSAPPTGFTPLMFAVRAGHIDATRVLLDAGADVDGTVSDGQSALVVAAANANWELAAYLLDRGADATQAEAGWNALHQTVRTRRMNWGGGKAGAPLVRDARQHRPDPEAPGRRRRRERPDDALRDAGRTAQPLQPARGHRIHARGQGDRRQGDAAAARGGRRPDDSDRRRYHPVDGRRRSGHL